MQVQALHYEDTGLASYASALTIAGFYVELVRQHIYRNRVPLAMPVLFLPKACRLAGPLTHCQEDVCRINVQAFGTANTGIASGTQVHCFTGHYRLICGGDEFAGVVGLSARGISSWLIAVRCVVVGLTAGAILQLTLNCADAWLERDQTLQDATIGF